MKEKRAFAVFVLIGGFCSGVNLGARIVIDVWTSYEVAILLAFSIAMTTAFLLNRRLVFRDADSGWLRQYWRFFLVNLATLVQIFLVSVGLARGLFPLVGFQWHADTVAHAIALTCPLLTSYWAHKRFSFAAPRPPTLSKQARS